MANNPYVNKVEADGQTLIDLTSDTAVAADVAQGKYFHLATGERVQGTSTGGGTEAGTVTQDQDGYLVLDDDPTTHITVESLSVTQNGTYTAPTGKAYSPVTVNVSGGGGLVYETGTWTPAEDISSYEIGFTNQHSSPPFMFIVADTTNTYSDVTNSSYGTVLVNWNAALGGIFNRDNAGSNYYGQVGGYYRNTSATSISIQNINISQLTGSTTSSSYASYWASTTGIKAYTLSSTRYWRTGRTYKWIAVWAPTS